MLKFLVTFSLLGWFQILGCNSRVYRDAESLSFSENNTILYNILEIFIPDVIINTYKMRDFLSGNYYTEFRKTNNDIESVNEIFNYALWITDNNIEQSLFLSSISTLPYKQTPAKFPLLNFDMMFYFSLESDSSFQKRYKNIPLKLFLDSPKNAFGDKDKLPHFFGSAFLTYISESKKFSKIVGNLIEFGEEIFQIEGFMDQRDLEANKLGALFGEKLLSNSVHKPSEFLGSSLLLMR